MKDNTGQIRIVIIRSRKDPGGTTRWIRRFCRGCLCKFSKLSSSGLGLEGGGDAGRWGREGRDGDVCAAIPVVLMRRVVLRVDPWEARMHERVHIKTRSGRCGAYRYIFQSWICRLRLHPLSGEGFRRSTHMIRFWCAARICPQLHGCRIHVAEVCNLDVPCTPPSRSIPSTTAARTRSSILADLPCISVADMRTIRTQLI